MSKRTQKQQKRKKRKQKKQRQQVQQLTRWDKFLAISRLREIREQILAASRPDSCIRSTKILCQLGELLDIRVEPFVVEANIFNPPFAEEIIKYAWEIPKEILATFNEETHWHGVIGSRCPEEREPNKVDGWPGHLVAIVYTPKNPYLVDLSIDQMNRPKRGVSITEPFVYELSESGFLEGEKEIGATHNDCVFLYRPVPEDRSFETAPDWIRDFDVGLTKERA